jgi:acetyl esterase/lipase
MKILRQAKSTFLICFVLCLFILCIHECMASPGGRRPGKRMPPRPVDTSWIREKYIDVVYATVSPSQKLDLYLPNEGEGPFPLIVDIHGGAFKMGKKSGQVPSLHMGLRRGYAVASIGYRLSGEAKFPAAVNDIKAAIKFLRRHAADYRLDPDRFATWGGSAGGTLALLAATSGDVADLVDPTMDDAEVSDAVQASVDWFGITDFTTLDEQRRHAGVRDIRRNTVSVESEYLGVPLGSSEALPVEERASPITYISESTPPVYIQHGTEDRIIPVAQSEFFVERLGELIGRDKVIFDKLDGAGHGDPRFNDRANIEKVFNFLDKYLK